MKRVMVGLLAVVLASCGGSIDSKKRGGEENNANNANNSNAENATSGPNGQPGPNNGPTPSNNVPEPTNSTANNEPEPINNEPNPNNEPEPTNNEPEPTNNEPEPTNGVTTGDACDNAADFEAVTSSETPYIARDCQLECLSAGNPRECTTDCVSVEVGTSLACSACVADLTECGLNNCAEQCIEDPFAPDCIACLEMFCDDDFVACSGIPAR